MTDVDRPLPGWAVLALNVAILTFLLNGVLALLGVTTNIDDNGWWAPLRALNSGVWVLGLLCWGIAKLALRHKAAGT